VDELGRELRLRQRGAANQRHRRAGQQDTYYYNGDGALTHVVNALGEVSETRYNALGQATQTIRYGTRIASGTLAGLNGGLADTTLTTR